MLPYLCIASIVLSVWFFGYALCRAAARGDAMWERAWRERVGN